MAIDDLMQKFKAAFPGSEAPRCCRVPGRVNLMGEHLDYNGLPVLPVALGEAIEVAFAPATSGRIHLRNTDPAYPHAQFQNISVVAPSAQGAWENYGKAAIQGINRALDVETFPGMNMLVASGLPANAGLSSSSALVVATAMAYLSVLESFKPVSLNRTGLAACLAEAEHFVGTRGGGMDQAVILCAKRGHAVKVDFFPLRIEQVPVPEDMAFVVCDSLVHARKSDETLNQYNAGPAQCRLATALVRRQLHETFGDDVHLARLGDLWQGHLCLTHHEAHDLCMAAVPDETTTLAAAGRRLGMTEAAIRETCIGSTPEPEGGFRLRARLRHILSEFHRVETARDAMLAGDLETLGALFNASHASCAEDYGISCPALDTLVAACCEAGASGARLTGAGFGGSVVSVLPRERVGGFLEAIGEHYYRAKGRLKAGPPCRLVDVSDGAAYL